MVLQTLEKKIAEKKYCGKIFFIRMNCGRKPRRTEKILKDFNDVTETAKTIVTIRELLEPILNFYLQKCPDNNIFWTY